MVPMLKELSGNTIPILEMRATDMCDDGTVNVGQIINEEHKPEVFSVGFGSYRGRLLLDVSGGCYAGYAGS
jgi:erythromycin esterase-like protein